MVPAALETLPPLAYPGKENDFTEGKKCIDLFMTRCCAVISLVSRATTQRRIKARQRSPVERGTRGDELSIAKDPLSQLLAQAALGATRDVGKMGVILDRWVTAQRVIEVRRR